MNDALVVVPTYNERENLPLLEKKLMGIDAAVDLLVVDDNSPDGTGTLAATLACQNPRVHVLRQQQKGGLGRAYVAGFEWGLRRQYTFILQMDGDLSHDPRDVATLLAAAEHADVVLGSRYINGIRIINWPLSRLMLSTFAAHYVKIVTGMPFTDPTGGFKCFRRRALSALDLSKVSSNGYSFQIEVTHRLWRQNMKMVEVPIIFTDRFHGSSKMSRQIIWEAIYVVWRLWFENSFRRHPTPCPSIHGVGSLYGKAQ